MTATLKLSFPADLDEDALNSIEPSIRREFVGQDLSVTYIAGKNDIYVDLKGEVDLWGREPQFMFSDNLSISPISKSLEINSNRAYREKVRGILIQNKNAGTLTANSEAPTSFYFTEKFMEEAGAKGPSVLEYAFLSSISSGYELTGSERVYGASQGPISMVRNLYPPGTLRLEASELTDSLTDLLEKLEGFEGHDRLRISLTTSHPVSSPLASSK